VVKNVFDNICVFVCFVFLKSDFSLKNVKLLFFYYNFDVLILKKKKNLKIIHTRQSKTQSKFDFSVNSFLLLPKRRGGTWEVTLTKLGWDGREMVS
jgi:hypothetical protein